MKDAQRRLMWHGMLLFLLGLLAGFAETSFANVRMGLASHLEGVMNGIFLLALGSAWMRLQLSDGIERLAFWTTLYGTYVNWLVTTKTQISFGRVKCCTQSHPPTKKMPVYMVRLFTFWSIAFLVLASGLAHSQQDIPPAHVFHPNQEVQVRSLRVRVASSADATAVLAAAVETVLNDVELCCGKGSALQDTVLSANPLSLKDVSAKLDGRHLLNDGRPFSITAEYLAPDSINPDQIIASLSKNHALVMEWKSQLYVLYGAIFDETLDYSGERQYVIHKLLLLDPHSSGRRRESVFNRETDNWKDVQGLLKLSVSIPQ